MQRLALLTRALRTRGKVASLERAIPLGARAAVVRVPRRSLPDTGAQVLVVLLEFSHDGGATWPDHVRFGTHGGDYIDLRGNLAIESAVRFVLPGDPDNPLRRVRAEADCREAIDLSLDLDVE